MRARNESSIKLDGKSKPENTHKRQRSIDLVAEDEDQDVTVTSLNAAKRGRKTGEKPPSNVEVLDLTGN